MKQLQYKKVFIKSNIKGLTYKKLYPQTFNLITTSSFFIYKKHIISIEKLIKIYKKKIYCKILVKTNIPVTSKGVASRMGSGVGFISNWVGKIKKGTIIAQCKKNIITSSYLSYKKESLELLKKIAFKLPIFTYIIENFQNEYLWKNY